MAEQQQQQALAAVERWGVFEVPLRGPSEGNPYIDVEVGARFMLGEKSVDVAGFYDGGGNYLVRFMPLDVGVWTYETRSNRSEMAGKTGEFACVPPSKGNRGPVSVRDVFHFGYADGTAYRQVGTTCYAWTHQGEELEKLTLKTLAAAPFNKIRMCVFPKWYAYNRVEPALYPFEGTPPDGWDFSRFNPAFFRHQEKRIGQLRELGIEADVILFHPYDEGHWRFDRMSPGDDDRYLRYVVARFGAYRNVWWSLANEFDFMKTKKPGDWDRFFKIVEESDPYHHLRSIHNGRLIYDHNKPWVTHVSMQNGSAVEDAGRAVLYRDVYNKPIVYDEVKYEGDIPERWGNLSGEEMVHRFWEGTIAGTYVGHGETYRHAKDVIWWSKGGELHGWSPPRLKFLRQIMEEGPDLEPIDKWQDSRTCGKAGEYYIVYLGKEKPLEWEFSLPRAGLAAGMTFGVEVIDTWGMTVEKVAGEFKIITDETYRYHAEGRKKVKLGGKPYMALRVRRTGGEVKADAGGTRVYGEEGVG